MYAQRYRVPALSAVALLLAVAGEARAEVFKDPGGSLSIDAEALEPKPCLVTAKGTHGACEGVDAGAIRGTLQKATSQGGEPVAAIVFPDAARAPLFVLRIPHKPGELMRPDVIADKTWKRMVAGGAKVKGEKPTPKRRHIDGVEASEIHCVLLTAQTEVHVSTLILPSADSVYSVTMATVGTAGPSPEWEILIPALRVAPPTKQALKGSSVVNDLIVEGMAFAFVVAVAIAVAWSATNKSPQQRAYEQAVRAGWRPPHSPSGFSGPHRDTEYGAPGLHGGSQQAPPPEGTVSEAIGPERKPPGGSSQG